MRKSEKMRIPAVIDQGRDYQCAISALHAHYKEFLELKASGGELVTDTADRYVLGYPVPPFQRELVWTEQQEVAFIESVWLGLPIGTYNLHQMSWSNESKQTRGISAEKFSGWLIDGQQRLNTIERYWNDEFTVFGLLWSELERPDVIRFKNTKFPYFESSLWDEEEIRKLYNLMAFGGTNHKESERA